MATSRATHNLLTVLKLIGVLVVAGVLAAGVLLPYVAGAGIAASKGADKFLDTQCDLKESALAQTTNIYANDGTTLIATLFTNNRTQIPLAQIPVMVQKALIDTEDRRFYEHHGVDTRGLLRAVVNQSSGGGTQGGSTLTQQYVKQVRYYQANTDAERAAAIATNSDRKIYEAKCALDLEKKYSKAQILEKYFNIAYFGEQSYGIAVAARNYFNTTPDKLTVAQAASLVGLVKDPTLYDPFQNPKPAKERRDEVIQNMVKAGDLSQAEADKEIASPVRTVESSSLVGAQGCSYANDAVKNVGFFCDYVVNWLTSKGGINSDKLASGGYKITTSIDPNLQNTATAALQAQFPASSPSTVIQPAINPATGEIKAFVTSKNYDYGEQHKGDTNFTTYPIFSKAFSGSGSTYKYFALIAALTAGVKPAQTITAGAPYATKNCGRDNKIKSNLINNAGNYAATLSLTAATVQSSNTFFVGLEDQLFGCDMSTIVNTAVGLGMTSLKTPDPSTGRVPADAVIADRSYTFTLGQESTSALELAEAYGVAANDGTYCQPKPVLSITDTAGKPVNFNQPTCTRQMSQWVARTAINILTGDTNSGAGTASSQFGAFYNTLNRSTHAVAGKTGTNNGSNAAGEDDNTNSAIWFVGATPTFVASSAIVSIDTPTKTIRGIPGFSDGYARTAVFGAVSAKYWIASFKPAVTADWTWPAAAGSGVAVPSVVGKTEAAAAAQLKAAGFVPTKYPIACAGPGIPGTVNFSGPEYAAPGSPAYYCMSSGKVLVKPTPTATPTTPGAPAPGQPTPAPAPTTAQRITGNTGGNGNGNGNGNGTGGRGR